jgi:hypothetical protein
MFGISKPMISTAVRTFKNCEWDCGSKFKTIELYNAHIGSSRLLWV